jgi:hypothetical protein
MPWTPIMKPTMAMMRNRGMKHILNIGSFPHRNMGSLVAIVVVALVCGKTLYDGLF